MSDIALIERLAAKPLVYKSVRVITLAQMDELHQRPKGTAGRNFREHREKMTEGKHFYEVPQAEYAKLETTNFVDSSSSHGGARRDLILLTERGYLMLVKSFRDSLAWEVQERLIDVYFDAPQKQPDRPIAMRLDKSYPAHLQHMNLHHKGCFSTVTACLDLMLLAEDWLVVHDLKRLPSDRMDVSIGRRYNIFRDSKGMKPITVRAPLLLPDTGYVAHVALYPYSEMGLFMDWKNSTYLPKDLADYLVRKYGSAYRLQAIKAASDICFAITGKHALLSNADKKFLALANAPKQQLMFSE